MWYAFSMGKYIGQNVKKYISCILVMGLTAALIGNISSEPLVAEATTIGEIQTNIQNGEEKIAKILEEISGLEDEQDLIEEQISDLNAEIVNTMASIGVLEDQIAEKEDQLAEKGTQIVEKQ